MTNKFSVDKIKQRIIQNLTQSPGKDTSINVKISLIGIDDLLKYEGQEFVQEVYLCLLDRMPDTKGFDSFLSLLQKGASKHWIIWCVKNSEEGKSKDIQVLGLIEPKTLSELLDLNGETFIKEAYKTLLWREVDLTGLRHFLTKLEKGKSKISIISELAYSKEAQNTPLKFIKTYSIKPPLKYFLRKTFNRESIINLIPKTKKKIKQVINLPFKIYEIYSNLNLLLDKHEDLNDHVINQLNYFGIELNNNITKQQSKLHKQLQDMEINLNTITSELFHQMQNLEKQIHDLKKLTKNTSSAIELISERKIVPAGNNTIFVKLEDFFLALPAEDLRLVFYLSYYNTLEAGLTSLFKKIVQPGMVVVDVGAHVGMYTLLAAPIVGANGKVYSFEPTPRTFDFLRLNIEINGYTQQVVAKQIAITDKKSLMNLSITEHSGLNSFYPFSEENNLVEVETYSLDVILKDEPHIDVIKIDTEGAEPLVWKGMQTIRERNPNILIFMEFAPTHLLRAGVNPKDFLAQILNEGFHTAKVDDFTGEIYPITEEELLNSYSVNLIIIKNLDLK